MDAKQLHILQHSLGLDEYGRGTFYRNRFVTGEGSEDHADCMALVDAGYMDVRKRERCALLAEQMGSPLIAEIIRRGTSPAKTAEGGE